MLVRASLAHLSEQLAARLDDILPPARLAPGVLLKKLLALTADPAIAPSLLVWADVSARVVSGRTAFRGFARAAGQSVASLDNNAP
ncbi:MAG: hypothetical protein H6924_12795 [Alphaproteobacteria bacterium]|nr:hypothetical protein [Alphaproteobacteria bacterium]